MIPSLKVASRYAIRLRGRLRAMCLSLARQPNRYTKKWEIQDGFLMVAQRSDTRLSGTIVDIPPHCLPMLAPVFLDAYGGSPLSYYFAMQAVPVRDALLSHEMYRAYEALPDYFLPDPPVVSIGQIPGSWRSFFLGTRTVQSCQPAPGMFAVGSVAGDATLTGMHFGAWQGGTGGQFLWIDAPYAGCVSLHVFLPARLHDRIDEDAAIRHHGDAKPPAAARLSLGLYSPFYEIRTEGFALVARYPLMFVRPEGGGLGDADPVNFFFPGQTAWASFAAETISPEGLGNAAIMFLVAARVTRQSPGYTTHPTTGDSPLTFDERGRQAVYLHTLSLITVNGEGDDPPTAFADARGGLLFDNNLDDNPDHHQLTQIVDAPPSGGAIVGADPDGFTVHGHVDHMPWGLAMVGNGEAVAHGAYGVARAPNHLNWEPWRYTGYFRRLSLISRTPTIIRTHALLDAAPPRGAGFEFSGCVGVASPRDGTAVCITRDYALAENLYESTEESPYTLGGISYRHLYEAGWRRIVRLRPLHGVIHSTPDGESMSSRATPFFACVTNLVDGANSVEYIGNGKYAFPAMTYDASNLVIEDDHGFLVLNAGENAITGASARFASGLGWRIAIYDTNTHQFSSSLVRVLPVIDQNKRFGCARPICLQRELADGDGKIIQRAVLAASFGPRFVMPSGYPSHADAREGLTHISYDSGATWQPFLPFGTGWGGAYTGGPLADTRYPSGA